MDKLINNLRKINLNKDKLIKGIPYINEYQSNEYLQYLSFDKTKYKKNLVYRDNDFEIFVVGWCPKQYTPVHDHSANGCLFKILEGSIIEQLYDKDLKFIGHKLLHKDMSSYIHNKRCYHSMNNISLNNSVSLHIYSPPNYEIKKF